MIEPVQKEITPVEVIPLVRFPFGLNTADPAESLDKMELAQCTNFKLTKDGKLKIRGGIKQYSGNVTTGDAVMVKSGDIGGTVRDIIATNDNKLYYMSGTTQTLIGTAEGNCSLIPFGDEMAVCDGSYLKYLDSVSEIKIATDDGDLGNMWDNLDGDNDTYMPIEGNASTHTYGQGIGFTTENWDAGYTIAPTRVIAKIKKVGSPSSTEIRCRILTTAATYADVAYDGDATSITTSGENITFEFSEDDITTELSPNTFYYAVIYITDASDREVDGDYYQLLSSTVGSDGAGYEVDLYSSDGGSTWVYSARTADATKEPLMIVQPGCAPKASFGVVKNSRLYIADATNKKRLRYNNLSLQDWSTTDGGGFIDLEGEIGGMEMLYNEIYIFGTEDYPFISKISGDSPSEYAIVPVSKNGWAIPKTIVNTTNDIWYGAATGVDRLTGVQEYGDLRTFSESDPVEDKLSYWTDAAFAGYCPQDGQYWLKLAGYTNVLVCHTKNPAPYGSRTRHPWTEYVLPCTPTCFGILGGTFIIGATDGYLYELTSEYFDSTSVQIAPTVKLAGIQLQTGFKESQFVGLEYLISAPGGATLTLDLYRNRATSAKKHTESVSIPTSDANLDLFPFFIDVNFNARSVQIGISSVTITTGSLLIEGFILKYRRL